MIMLFPRESFFFPPLPFSPDYFLCHSVPPARVGERIDPYTASPLVCNQGRARASVMQISDLEGGGMETLCKTPLESGKSVLESAGATVQQLVAAHREALNTIGRDVTVTLARCTCLGSQLHCIFLHLRHA